MPLFHAAEQQDRREQFPKRYRTTGASSVLKVILDPECTVYRPRRDQTATLNPIPNGGHLGQMYFDCHADLRTRIQTVYPGRSVSQIRIPAWFDGMSLLRHLRKSKTSGISNPDFTTNYG